jgi:hypothetical protein
MLEMAREIRGSTIDFCWSRMDADPMKQVLLPVLKQRRLQRQHLLPLQHLVVQHQRKMTEADGSLLCEFLLIE